MESQDGTAPTCIYENARDVESFPALSALDIRIRVGAALITEKQVKANLEKYGPNGKGKEAQKPKPCDIF